MRRALQLQIQLSLRSRLRSNAGVRIHISRYHKLFAIGLVRAQMLRLIRSSKLTPFSIDALDTFNDLASMAQSPVPISHHGGLAPGRQVLPTPSLHGT